MERPLTPEQRKLKLKAIMAEKRKAQVVNETCGKYVSLSDLNIKISEDALHAHRLYRGGASDE